MQIPILISTVFGAIGAAAMMLLKYFVDQHMEKHKVELNLAAKRRERYHEKQVNAIEGTYELLAGYVAACASIYAFKHTDPTTDERFRDSVKKAEEVRDEFQAFFPGKPSISHMR